MLKISETQERNHLILKVEERRLDHVISAEFRDWVLGRAAGHRGAIVLDLSAVEFMDSSGLGAVVGIRKRLGWSVRIVLAGLRGPVYRVFELARMTDVFSFYASAEAAIRRARA